MSLRAFHLLFVGLSVALCAFSGAWAVERYRALQDATYAATAGGSFLSAAALAWYGAMFQKKTRGF